MPRYLIPALLSLLLGAPALGSTFAYNVEITPDGYHLSAELRFSPEVTLIQLVHNLRNPTLFSQLNPTMLAGQLIEKNPNHYDLITAFKVLGFHFEMLSHCVEKNSGDGSAWDRQCVLDTSERDAARFMISKSEDIHCEQSADARSTACTLQITGRLKKFPLLNPGKLGVKAKVQSLLNWGMFWTYTDRGSISTVDSKRIFGGSPLKADIDRLLSDGLSQATESGPDFHLRKSGRFEYSDAP